ncbi:hypothetical protein MKX01_033616 [Papaver californicum]|nr:hypothetical protein MKX01_033616 [Papaver californicum]
MMSSSHILLPLLVLVFFSSVSWAANNPLHGDFLQCIKKNEYSSIPIPIYTPDNSTFTTIFRSSARNLRFLTSNSTQTPQFIITPTHESHVQSAVVCCRKHGFDLKVRSGGHDVEGLSYVSDTPYVLVDLINFRDITVDIKNKTAWIRAGASLGEVYYQVANKSNNALGFPAGGGGFGALVRKYGLASDQVIDARIVTVDGKIYTKGTMGKNLFWAIRGGGANNFGVILSWKVKLVPVTPVVTVATISRTLEQGATDLVHKWQFIADRLHEDPSIRKNCVSFSFLFLGGSDRLLELMEESFPELGLKRNETTEMKWVESHVYFYARGRPIELLWDRDHATKSFLKIKADYVREPISKSGLEAIWRRFTGGDSPAMLWTPFGGRMNEISESETPYPHRAGNIYNIMYVGNWQNETESEKQIDWMRRFYNSMARYVSKNPRLAYINYQDLDLGVNGNNVSELVKYVEARSWGRKYFKSNFERLVKVKSMVDPSNFFKNKQNIPPVTSWGSSRRSLTIMYQIAIRLYVWKIKLIWLIYTFYISFSLL